jgi:hypothetical protein
VVARSALSVLSFINWGCQNVGYTVLKVTTSAASLEYVSSHVTTQLQNTFDHLTSRHKATHCIPILTGLPGPSHGSRFSRRPLSAKTRFRSLANLRSIFGEQRSNKTRFSLGTSGFHWVNHSSPINIIPPLLYVHSLIYHRRRVTFATYSVFKFKKIFKQESSSRSVTSQFIFMVPD